MDNLSNVFSFGYWNNCGAEMRKQHISGFKVAFFIVIMLFSVLFLSSNTEALFSDNITAYYALNNDFNDSIDSNIMTNVNTINTSGIIYSGRNLNYNTGYLNISGNVIRQPPFTFNLWINLSSFTACDIFSKRTIAPHDFDTYIDINGSYYLRFYNTDTAKQLLVSYNRFFNTSLNNWTMITVSLNGNSSNNLSVYKNSILQNITSIIGDNLLLPIKDTTNIRISNGGAGFCNGSVDDIGMWNKTLNQSEITDIYLSYLSSTISPFYVSPTEINNSQRTSNNIIVNVSLNTSFMLKNITIYLYNSSKSLIANYTNTTYPFFVNFTNLTNSGIYYYNATTYNIVENYNATITQQMINLSIYGYILGFASWRFSNNYVNYTINLTSGTTTGEYNQNSTNYNISLSEGIYNITLISKNSTTINNNCTYLNVNITFLNTANLGNCSFFDALLNISVKNSTSINVTNYTITITSFNNSYSETQVVNSTSGLAMINVTKNYNYSVGIDAQSNPNYIYAYNNFTLNITSNSWFNTTLALTNSVNITIYTEGTANRINIPFNITFIQNNSETTANFINGTAFFWNFSVGYLEIKIPTTNTTGYSQRIYNLIINNRSTQYLSAYLITNPYFVVFNVVDYNSGLNIEGALITMYVQTNSTWNAVSSQYSDITGRVQFVYNLNQRYRFYVVKTGYTTKVFDLDSILFSSYTIPLTSSSSSSNTQDYSGISLTYSPSQYWNGLNNFSFYIANPYSQLLTYGYNLSYPNGQVNNSGTNSIGQILTSLNFNISTSDFRDKVTLVYWYQINGSNLKTYSRQFDILGITSNWTLMNNFNNTYGLGDFERVLVSTLVVIIIAGIVGLVIGALWGVMVGFIIYLYLSYIGFLSWWFLLLPFIATLLIIWARSGSNG